LHNKTPIYSTWGLLRVCAACPTPRLNQSYELRPLWEQHLRYVPHRVRNGYNKIIIIIKNPPQLPTFREKTLSSSSGSRGLTFNMKHIMSFGNPQHRRQATLQNSGFRQQCSKNAQCSLHFSLFLNDSYNKTN